MTKNGHSTGERSYHRTPLKALSLLNKLHSDFLLVVGLYSNYEVKEESKYASTFCEHDSAFTRISAYYDWIQSHDVGDMCD